MGLPSLPGRERHPRFANRTPQPYMGRIGVHARMPGHQIIESTQHFWWLENSQGQIGRFELREAAWDGRE